LEEKKCEPPFLYGISDRSQYQDVQVSDYLTTLFQTPAHIIQWREKDLSRAKNRGFVRRGKQLASDTGKIFLVNTDLELAVQERADGAHLTSRQDLEVAFRTREESNLQRFILGQSVHSILEAVRAERQGADYVLLAPIFDPISKESLRPALGLSVLREAAEAVSIPVFGLGGTTEGNSHEVVESGAAGIAGISWLNDYVSQVLHAS
jgi:thiamine-phosphate diphosphorylase